MNKKKISPIYRKFKKWLRKDIDKNISLDLASVSQALDAVLKLLKKKGIEHSVYKNYYLEQVLDRVRYTRKKENAWMNFDSVLEKSEKGITVMKRITSFTPNQLQKIMDETDKAWKQAEEIERKYREHRQKLRELF